MSVTSAPASGRRVRRGALPIAAVSVLVIVAAIAGLLLGGSFGGTPAVPRATAPQTIAHDGIRLQVPNGWTRADIATAPGFVRPLGLRNADHGLRASVERLPVTSATLLPAAFLRTLETAPDWPEVARLAGGRQAWRYRFSGQDGSMTLLYAAPTTSGVTTIACTSPIDTSIPRACDALAAAVTVPGSRPLAPSSSAAFFTRLPAAVSDLDAARAKDTEELRAAKRSAAQALAADGLALAHKAAGAALAPLANEGDGLPSATVGALARTATAYTALASAARARSPQRYAGATRAVISADADLRRTMTKVAAAASAATQSATQVGSTPTHARAAPARPAAPAEPAATPKPVASKSSAPKPSASTDASAKPPPDAIPVASAARGIDLTLIILALLAVIAILVAVRGTLRQLR